MFAKVQIELAGWYLPVQTSNFSKEIPHVHFQSDIFQIRAAHKAAFGAAAAKWCLVRSQ
jgi:hypothetical protein